MGSVIWTPPHASSIGRSTPNLGSARRRANVKPSASWQQGKVDFYGASLKSIAIFRFGFMLRFSLRRAAYVGLLGAAVLAPSAAACAQDSVSVGETRAALVARARRADSLHLQAESFALHARLQDGDFEVGDHVTIVYSAPNNLGLTKTDDLIVRSGKVLQMGEPMGDLNLSGVLRSELYDLIKQRVDTYYKNEVLHVTTYIRLSVAGAVRNAGFFYTRPDQSLNDVIMGTGGRDPAADFTNVVIKRGGDVVWSKEDVQVAFNDGLTIGKLNLQPGDEIVVGYRAQDNWRTILQFASYALTTGLSLYLLFRRR